MRWRLSCSHSGTDRTSSTFVASFDTALAAPELTTLVAKVDAVGPAAFVTDLALLANRFQFARHLRSLQATRGIRMSQTLLQLDADLASGSVQVIDLPPVFATSLGLTMEVISRYDEHGPGWHWSTITLGEHTGTHFDAGQAGRFTPPFPNRTIMHGAGKFGLASLCNLDRLPTTSAS